jgi:hypothetical protein
MGSISSKVVKCVLADSSMAMRTMGLDAETASNVSKCKASQWWQKATPTEWRRVLLASSQREIPAT